MRFHRLDRAQDQRFWSVRVGRDLRIIVHRSDASLLLCYVGHHEDACAWAERRRRETARLTWVVLDDEVVPGQARIETVGDDANLRDMAPAR